MTEVTQQRLPTEKAIVWFIIIAFFFARTSKAARDCGSCSGQKGKKKERVLLPHEEDSPRSLNALRHAAALVLDIKP